MKPRLREDCLGKWATLGLQGRGCSSLPWELGGLLVAGMWGEVMVGGYPRACSFTSQVIVWAVGPLGQPGAAGESLEGKVQARCEETSWATPGRCPLQGWGWGELLGRGIRTRRFTGPSA